jgi:hypothetical protein
MPYASFHYPGVFTAVIEFLEEGEKYKCSITDLLSKEQAVVERRVYEKDFGIRWVE